MQKKTPYREAPPVGGSFTLRIIREKESESFPEGAVFRISTPWLIAKMRRFKFSPERPSRS